MQSKVDLFLQEIMNIQVLRAGGAAAGMFGMSGTDSDVVNSLKKKTMLFAKTYQKATPDDDSLQELSNAIMGFLQTLQLMNTLSEQKTNELIDRLQSLMPKT